MKDFTQAFSRGSGNAAAVAVFIVLVIILCGAACFGCVMLSNQFDELAPPAGIMMLWLM